MKKYILYIIAIISILFLIRCEKDENPDLLKAVFTNKVPELTTVVLSEITDTSAFSGGIINNDGGSKIIANGVCWSISPNPTTNDTKTMDSIGKVSFISKLTALKPFTTYYVRAYAINTVGIGYGNTLTFKTSTNLAKITTKDITNITDSSAICGGDISTDGGAEITARGVCWNTLQNPSINDIKTSDSIGIGSFVSNPKGLNAITMYYLRAYVTNGVGTAYGEEKIFTTPTSLPKLTTAAITSMTSNSAVSGGFINSNGGIAITAKGVCWSTSSNPTTADNKTENGTGSTAFTSNITGLTPNITYYVRAYATNNLGTGYGNERVINTPTTLPLLTTNAITSITDSSAVSGGNITSDGGLTITVRGICWSTSQNPTIANNKTINGNGTGSFISNLTGLTAGTTFYVRAYATNSSGTVYGNQINFTTLSIPSLITTSATSITYNSANSGGNITNDGGTIIISRGVCWSTSPNPTITNSITSNGSGTGSFTSNLTGLTGNITYYLRAFATNIIGTAYGNEISFTTLAFTVSDYDGNIYDTIHIGTQVWMKQNLKTTKYRNGNAIPNITNNTTWTGLTTGAYCDYNNIPTNSTTYGRLYNWYAVNTGNLCPTGWHVPSDAEWSTLITYLGGENIAGGKLKEAGLAHWSGPNTAATNENGFTALPGGYRDYNGLYFGIGDGGYWRSSTEYNISSAWGRYMTYGYGNAVRYDYSKAGGFSVRCLID